MQHTKTTDTMITLADLDEFMPPSNADGTSFQPTEEGNKVLTQGSEIYEKYNRRGFFGVPPPRQDDIDRYGGKETLKLWFGTFYCRMFQDPRMNVLFDVRHEEANVSAAEHGKRLYLALLLDGQATANTFELETGGISFIACMWPMIEPKSVQCEVKPCRELASLPTSEIRGWVTCFWREKMPVLLWSIDNRWYIIWQL
jgi:hypothetical protein